MTQVEKEWQFLTHKLGDHQPRVEAALEEMKAEDVMTGIWGHDHTVWKADPTEITNRLGWLHIANTMLENLPRLEDLASELHAEGYTHVLLLGMGGSSLAPEVFRKTFGVAENGLDLAVLDSTDPGAVEAWKEGLDFSKTVFIVASKSGGTVETISFFKYFYTQVKEILGDEQAGEHFIAITDPGSKLVDIARTYHFRKTFLNDPHIGGRYSALSYFGLVPAALVGVDVETLLQRSLIAQQNCQSANCPVDGNNHGARLGVIMGELAKTGRDKITLVTSPTIASFGDWVEQLIAESTGKEGLGILPVVGEPLGAPENYGDDRLFVHLQLADDDTHEAALKRLEDVGHPVVRLRLRDTYDLGSQFFLWEMATAVAGYRLGVNPFDQPNVESAKILAKKMVEEYMETGQLPTGDFTSLTPAGLEDFLSQARTGDYISLQAYVEPTPATDKALSNLRVALRDRYKLATTVGYGPRFLHSTGQLHKGDGGNGLFVQLVSTSPQEVPIPDEAGESPSTMSFGILKAAQALGDAQALHNADRRVIRFEVGQDLAQALRFDVVDGTGGNPGLVE